MQYKHKNILLLSKPVSQSSSREKCIYFICIKRLILVLVSLLVKYINNIFYMPTMSLSKMNEITFNARK